MNGFVNARIEETAFLSREAGWRRNFWLGLLMARVSIWRSIEAAESGRGDCGGCPGFMERGWFPRAVPPAGGLRAARGPGLNPNTKEQISSEVLERAVTDGQGPLAIATFAPNINPTKLRFLLRQDRTVLYPPLVRSFLFGVGSRQRQQAVKTKRIHRRTQRAQRKNKG